MIELPSRSRLGRVDDIKALVADSYGISRDHMASSSRDAHHAQPRQIAMYLTREMRGLSYPLIGRLFGHRDHTTVIYACKAVRERMRNNRDLRADVKALMDALSANRR